MRYKTIFVDAPTAANKGAFGVTMHETNGDQLARDVQAAILEKDSEGYELFQSMPVTSSLIYSSAYPYSFTTGVVLIFKQKIQ
ncbi:MAG: hypothetical protein HY842_11360 [Bacteroidetes bacterium]|nr:hypothetical protein [Bacteroidota bacterium]